MFERIKRLFGYGATEQGPDYLLSDPRVAQIFGWGSRSSAGVTVNAQTSLTCSAWWRAQQLLSDAVAKVPYGVYEVLPEGKGRIADTKHPWNYTLSKKPGQYWTAFQWRKLMAFWLAGRGNAYAYIDRVNFTLNPMCPDELTPIVGEDGKLWYHHKSGKFYNPDEILHYKGLGYDGLVGYSVLEYAADSLGLNMGARQFQSSTLKNSARPSVILQFPTRLKDTQKKEIIEDWKRMTSGRNVNGVTIVDGQMEVKPFTQNATDIALIQTMQFTIGDISNFTGVPAHKLGNKDGASYNSLEQETLAWNTDTLEALYVNIEQEDEDKLLTEEEKTSGTHEIYFDRVKAAFQSADLSAKSNYLRVALGGAPYMEIAEARRMDNLNYRDGTEEIPKPANMGGKQNDPNNPAGDGPGKPSATVSFSLKDATAAAMDQAIQRVFKRLSAQMKSAAKQGPGALSKWFAEVRAKNLGAVAAELATLEQAAGEAHGVELYGKVACQLISRVEHIGKLKPSEFLAAWVDDRCKELEAFTLLDVKKKIQVTQEREANGQFGQGDGSGKSDAEFSKGLETAMQGKAEMGPRGFPIYRVDGKDYMVKQGQAYSKSEQMGAQYSKDANVDVVGVREAKVQGRTVNAVEFQRSGFQDMGKMSETQKGEAIRAADPKSVERQTLYNYVIGHTDPNDGNFFIKDGKLVGLDKDPSFSAGKDKSAQFTPPQYLRHVGGENYAFSRGEVEHMAGAADKIATKLEAAGQKRDAVGVRARGDALRQLIQLHGDRPTLRQLDSLGQGLDVSKSWIGRIFGV